MERTYWHKQTPNNPLFPDLLWSRPENRAHAGKLLIVGGNLHAFAAPAEAFQVADKTGAGNLRVMLPDALHKVVKGFIDIADFAPSTPSGSFSQKATSDILEHAAWADTVLFAGDLGRNSETAIMMENFLLKHTGNVVLTKDAIEYITSSPSSVAQRANTVLVLSLSQLQRLFTALGLDKAVTLGMSLLQLVELLHEYSATFPFSIVTKHHDHIICAHQGEVSTTETNASEDIWRVTTAAKVSVWVMQNPSKVFEALSVSVTL